MRHALFVGLLALLPLAAACGGSDAVVGATPIPQPTSRAAAATSVVTPTPLPPTVNPTPTVEPTPRGPTFILLRAKEVTADARLNFMGQGFQSGERTAVTIEDGQGNTVASLDPVKIEEDGRINEVSVPVPGGLTPGVQTLRVAGLESGRSARTTFRLRWLPPTVKLLAYSGKAKHSFGFTGSGFAPGEQIEVRLGGLGGSPLATVAADSQGTVTAVDIPMPLVEAGDYPLYFVGRESESPISIGFNVQGFRPWAVLDNYSPPPYYLMGFSGEDFVPDEVVLVYLNGRTHPPVTQVQADSTGRFTVKNAFELPELKGENEVLFVGQQSNVEITASFMAMAFGPSLELTVYAGRPGSQVAFVGTGWAKNETLRVIVGDTGGQRGGSQRDGGTFKADASGAFSGAGSVRLPVRLAAGGLPLTVRGEVSQAEVTLWFQVLDLKPTAELSAYQGPPGTVISFTGRSFASGETVHVHLESKDGPDLGQAVADGDGTFERLSSYPVEGDWGDTVKFVMVGAESDSQATTHFKFETP